MSVASWAADLGGLQGTHMLLVDDVLTTGTTACETADTLITGGAECVTLVACARTLLDDRPTAP